jgi:transcription elongation factor Elf1
MAAKTEKKVVEVVPEKEITFKCKFCGEEKPFCELVVMRQYYPQIAACKKCAIGTRNVEEEVIKEETVTEEPVE